MRQQYATYLLFFLLAMLAAAYAIERRRGRRVKLLLSSSIDTNAFPLKPNSCGKEVAQLQRYLNQEKGAGIAVTGILDGSTQQAVEKLLHRKNGMVGMTTFAKWQVYKY